MSGMRKARPRPFFSGVTPAARARSLSGRIPSTRLTRMLAAMISVALFICAPKYRTAVALQKNFFECVQRRPRRKFALLLQTAYENAGRYPENGGEVADVRRRAELSAGDDFAFRTFGEEVFFCE